MHEYRLKTSDSIAQEIELQIATGRILAGERLPSAREAAATHGVDRNTIAAAYRILKRRGLVEARVPEGTFVIDPVRSQSPLPWKRWWRRLYPDQEPAPVEFFGLMLDPEMKHSPNAHLRSLDALSDRPVLILLGEAGAGKTVESRRLGGHSDHIGGKRSVHIDLGPCESSTAMERAISEHEAVKEWMASTSLRLDLILDSFDEAGAIVKALADNLIRILKSLPRERLNLRVFCRGNAWPETLGNRLQELWPEDDVEQWELAPLTRGHIKLAATASELDEGLFWDQVQTLGLEELAKRPITLFMLIDAAKKGTLEGTSVAQLYETCLLQLLESPALPRYRRRTARPQNPLTLLLWAEAVAACSVLCGSQVFGLSALPDADDGRITVSGLLNTLPLSEEKRPDRGELEDLFNSALFAPAGQGRVQFAHRSYAEFLTARWLVRSGITDDVIMSILTVGQGIATRVAPQLHAVAAWVAGMRPQFFERLVSLDPDALLRGDLESLDNRQRSALVTALLDAVREERISRARLRSVQHAFKRLSHPGIATQLRTVITDNGQAESVREAAIDIAEAACAEEVGNELVSLMLDPVQPMRLRTSAGYALRGVKHETVRRRLVPMARGEVEGDRELTLRGCALHCVWPDLMTTEDLFNTLTPESAPNLYASYASFLERVPQTLKPNDLPIALAWVSRMLDRSDAHGSLERACLRTIRRAWEQLDTEPELAQLLAPIVEQRLERHDGFLTPPESASWRAPAEERADLQKEIQEHSARRHALVMAVIERADGEHRLVDVVRLLYSETPLVVKEDLRWLIEKATTEGVASRAHWIELANRSVLHHPPDAWSPEDTHWIIAARRKAADTDLFDFIDPVLLKSPLADKLRKHHAEIKAFGRPRKRARSRGRKAQALRDQAEYLLTTGMHTPVPSWTWLAQLLYFGQSWDAESSAGSASVTRLSSKPLWRAADSRLKQAVLQAAQRTLESCCPVLQHPLPDTSGDAMLWHLWLALQLLQDEDRGWLEKQSAAWWSSWAPLVTVGVGDRLEPDDASDRGLAELSLSHAKARVIHHLTELLRSASSNDRPLPSLKLFDTTSDPDLHRVLVDALSSSSGLGPQAFASAFELLLSIAPGEARQVASRWFADAAIGSAQSREQSTAAARLAADLLDDAAWPLLWPAMKRHPVWGLDVLHRLIDRYQHDENPFWLKLQPDELGELIYWMNTDLPLGILPDRSSIDVYRPTKEEEVDRLRQTATHGLVKRHPAVARRVMERLRRARPDNPWFAHLLVEATDGSNAWQWQPLKLDVLKRLATDHRSRYVETSEQLLALVAEAIRSFEHQLHDKFTPLIHNLWNTCPGNGVAGGRAPSTPQNARNIRSFKGEEHLTDNLVAHLRRELEGRGIVANREVQISRPSTHPGDPRGKRLDILVQAVNPHHEPLRVIIEVKVDSNPDWKHGFGDQLLARYLNAHACRTGLYVVAWTGAVKLRRTIETGLTQAMEADGSSRPLFTVQSHVIDCRIAK